MPSSIELLTNALDTRLRGAASLAVEAAGNAVFSPRNVIAGASGVVAALRSLADASMNPPVPTPFDRPTGTDRRFMWWSVALDDVKRIGRRLGGTINDVALTLVSEAFAQTVANSDGRDLRVYCPVGDSSDVSTLRLGNRVSGMLLDLPVDCPDLKARWHRVRSAAREGKQNGAVESAFLLENIANSLTPSLLARLEQLTGGTRTFNLIMTNVPGPQVPLYLFEQRMTGVCPLVPLFRGQGLGIAIFSYAGLLTWGFHVDANCIDAARKLRSALATAVIKMARLADQTVSGTQEKAQPIPLHTPRVARDRVASAAG